MARVSSKPHSFGEVQSPSSSSLGLTHVQCKRPNGSPFPYRLSRRRKRRPGMTDQQPSFIVTSTSPGSDEILSSKQKTESIASASTQQQQQQQEKGPMIKIHFTVPFRCHSRQMLCMGGSQFPFGWSFVSIAKVPMIWNPNDFWTAEAYLPLGMRLEYKYVILEEQVWTNQQNEDSEGVVEVAYRTGTSPGQPPDVQKIRKQMAIVDWQPGPNRVIQVPFQEEIDRLTPGKKIQRRPARPRPYITFRKVDTPTDKDVCQGTWEELCLEHDGQPVLYRQDVWPYKSATLTIKDARKLYLEEG